MTKVLYLDCFSGISGDMFLGMLVDMGIPLADIESSLRKLDLPDFQLKSEPISYSGITGTKVHVKVPEEHAHRHLKDIMALARSGDFSAAVVDRIEALFTTLAKSEAKVHGTTPDKVHFHEVGALDSIIDIFGCAVGLELLGIDKIVASPIHTGTGFINCQHGKIPVPAPATLEILSERRVPIYSQGIAGELCTPTGASIIASLAETFGPCPSMNITTIGYGAGSKQFQHPNLLRGILGTQAIGENYGANPNRQEHNHDHHHSHKHHRQSHNHHSHSHDHKDHQSDAKKNLTKDHAIQSDRVFLLQANLDDMNPEFYTDFMDKAYNYGALDVWFTPCQMKKQRPGIMVEIIAPPDKVTKIREILFTYTTTLGVRSCLMDRVKLAREKITVNTNLGAATVKLGTRQGKVYNWAPEYESIKCLAEQHDLPVKEVYQLVSQQYLAEHYNK